jgi:hypothetical protein
VRVEEPFAIAVVRDRESRHTEMIADRRLEIAD